MIFVDVVGETVIKTCLKCGAKNRVDDRANSMTPVCGRCGAALPAHAEGFPEQSNHPIIVTDETFAEAVLDSAVPVLLDCWAPWCGPCRMLTPTLESLAAEANGNFRVAKLNVDENPGTAARLQISSIPNVLLFYRGKLVEQLVGLRQKAAYLDAIKALK